MTLTQRIVREPALVLGVITAGLSLAVLFGLDISKEQFAGIGTFLGTVFALVRFVTTPAAEVIVQQKPNEEPKATASSNLPTGLEVVVEAA